MSFSCQWSERVSSFSREDWERCFDPGNVLTSYSLQQALERSQLVEGFHYLSLRQEGKLLAIISCFSLSYSLTDLSAPGAQRLMAGLRKFFPGLLKPRLFMVGSPLATCTHMLGIVLPPEDPGYPDLIRSMEREIDRKASELGIRLLCLKEFDHRLSQSLALAWQSRFLVCRSPDTTYVYTRAVAGLDYVENMRSRYRDVLKIRKKAFAAAGLRWELVRDFAPHVDVLHRLYLNVWQRSRFRFERLTPAFFHAVNEALGDQASVLLCLDGERIVAFELLLNGQRLHPLYLGVDYDYQGGGALYFNCLYRAIEEAQSQRKALVELGQSSYEAKFSVGAVSSRRYFHVKHAHPLGHFLLNRFKGWLFPAPHLPEPRRVFKYEEEYLQALKSEGVL